MMADVMLNVDFIFKLVYGIKTSPFSKNTAGVDKERNI